MKKKILVYLTLLFLISTFIFAQTTDLKRYSDYNKNFSGYAVAIYQDNLMKRDISDKDFYEVLTEKLNPKLSTVEKLTKKNNWLFRQAINEYDYEKGEVYIVVCGDSLSSTEALMFFVYVKGKDDFVWKAYHFNEDDLSNLENLFDFDKEKESDYVIPSADDYISGQREIFDWYTSLGIIQGKSKDDNPATVRIDVAFAYKKGDTDTPKEITERTVEIKAFLRRYIASKTSDELREPRNEETFENEIKNELNDKVLTSGRIRDVVFVEKDVIE